jgi:hypothetical protein
MAFAFVVTVYTNSADADYAAAIAKDKQLVIAGESVGSFYR